MPSPPCRHTVTLHKWQYVSYDVDVGELKGNQVTGGCWVHSHCSLGYREVLGPLTLQFGLSLCLVRLKLGAG